MGGGGGLGQFEDLGGESGKKEREVFLRRLITHEETMNLNF